MNTQWKRWVVAAMLGCGVTAFAAEDAASSDMMAQIEALGWTTGPAKQSLGSRAEVALDKHTGILNEADSSKFLELNGNLPSTGLNVVAHGNWWATFEFDPVGYVKDNDHIDANELLQQLKNGDGPSNEARRKRGMVELTTEGWHIPPKYDPATRQLEWALRLRAAGDPEPIINYTVRLLGRSGYERAVLVSTPEALDADVKEFKTLLQAFAFKDGEKYTEFKQGDRVAEFGLAALVVGGAAAVAAKTGFWKVLVGILVAGWKFVAMAAVALLAGVGSLFKRKAR